MNERGKDDDMIEAVRRAYGGTHDPRATIQRFLEAAAKKAQSLDTPALQWDQVRIVLPWFLDFLATYEETP